MSASEQEWQEMQMQQQIEEQRQMELLRAEQERLADEKSKANVPPPVVKRKHGLTAADKAALRKRQEWEQSEQGRQEMERQKKIEDEENEGRSNGFLDKSIVWLLIICVILILFFEAPTI